MMYFIIDNIRFDISCFEKNLDGLSSSYNISIEVRTGFENLEVVEKLSNPSINSYQRIFNIELEPKGILRGCAVNRYTIIGDIITIDIRGTSFDPAYINLRKKRLQKLKQLNNV